MFCGLCGKVHSIEVMILVIQGVLQTCSRMEGVYCFIFWVADFHDVPVDLKLVLSNFEAV